jgi:hypothetical protein
VPLLFPSHDRQGDYLTTQEIKTRAKLGLDSINIAPEFGVQQTILMLDIFSEQQTKEALSVCKKVEKYKKWIPENLLDNPPADLILKTSGHYCFTMEPFASCANDVKLALKDRLYQRFNNILNCWEKNE